MCDSARISNQNKTDAAISAPTMVCVTLLKAQHTIPSQKDLQGQRHSALNVWHVGPELAPIRTASDSLQTQGRHSSKHSGEHTRKRVRLSDELRIALRC